LRKKHRTIRIRLQPGAFSQEVFADAKKIALYLG